MLSVAQCSWILVQEETRAKCFAGDESGMCLVFDKEFIPFGLEEGSQRVASLAYGRFVLVESDTIVEYQTNIGSEIFFSFVAVEKGETHN